METKIRNSPLLRDGRSRAERLTVELPPGMLTALKMHTAQLALEDSEAKRTTVWRFLPQRPEF